LGASGAAVRGGAGSVPGPSRGKEGRGAGVSVKRREKLGIYDRVCEKFVRRGGWERGWERPTIGFWSDGWRWGRGIARCCIDCWCGSTPSRSYKIKRSPRKRGPHVVLHKQPVKKLNPVSGAGPIVRTYLAESHWHPIHLQTRPREPNVLSTALPPSIPVRTKLSHCFNPQVVGS
jgi:hypothetical protein